MMNRILTLIFIITGFSSCNNQTSPQTTEYSVNFTSAQIQECDEIARKILTTSQRYIDLTKGLSYQVQKNGGKYLGLEIESSPFKKEPKQASNMYYFALYEMYPDHQLNIARFAFDDIQGVLYEIDLTNNRKKSMPFNHRLLEEYPCRR